MPGGRAEMAAGLVATMRQVGGVLGISVMGLVVQAHSADAVTHGGSVLDAYVDGVAQALALAAALLGGRPVVALALLRGARRSVAAV